MGQAPQFSGRNVYWCSIPTRERACIQLTGRSVEIIYSNISSVLNGENVRRTTFSSCLLLRQYAWRRRIVPKAGTQFLLLVLSFSNHYGSPSRTKIHE